MMTLSLFLFPFFYCRFLEFFPPSIEFVVASIAIRAVHATGNAFVITATFTYAAGAFDKSVGTVFVRIYYHHSLAYSPLQDYCKKIVKPQMVCQIVAMNQFWSNL